MKTVLKIALGAVVGFLALAPASSPASSRASVERSIRTAFTEFKSGLRHADGKLTCSRMTLRYRQQILSAAASGGVAGVGCETFFDVNGRDIYNDIKSKKLLSISVKGSRAKAKTDAGSLIIFVRSSGRWRLDSARQPAPEGAR